MVPSFLIKRKWILPVGILAGVILFAVNHYHSQLWTHAVKLYDIYQDPHQLKKVISSFGAVCPISLYPAPNHPSDCCTHSRRGDRILRRLPIWGVCRSALSHDWARLGVLGCLQFGEDD